MRRHLKNQPRTHLGLAWEEKTLTNEFIDVNRLALDDAYGKVAAPFSKRRNGVVSKKNIKGLFGLGHVAPQSTKRDYNLNEAELKQYEANQVWLMNNDITKFQERDDGLSMMMLKNRANHNVHLAKHTEDYQDPDWHRKFHQERMRDESPSINWNADNRNFSIQSEGELVPTSSFYLGFAGIATLITVAGVGIYALRHRKRHS